jgi:hypothetical protein
MADERVRRGGRPRRREREATGAKVEPVPPGPVHAAKAREARGYRWETAAPNNYLAVVSGHRTERIVTRLAAQLVDWLTGEYPDLADPRYRFSVASWARSEAVVALLTHHFDQHDVVDGDGEPRQTWLTQLRAAERRAGEERRVLGLSPADHPRLERERSEAVKAAAVDLSEIRAAGRKALRARGEGA